MSHHPTITKFFLLAALWLILASCATRNSTPVAFTSDERAQLALQTPTEDFGNCTTCADATLAALQTEEQDQVNANAASAAEIMRANAQTTLDSAISTLRAAQTQEQNNADIIAAQAAATAAIIRAEALATLDAAESTQGAAQTQDAIQQTQAVAATVKQESKDALAAGTQTASANLVSTQTRAAAATSQWYTDQDRIRSEQWQTPLTLLWFCCLPLLIISIAIAGFLAFSRWAKIQEAQQQIDVRSASRATAEAKPNNSLYPLSKTQDHVRQWLEEVKSKLLTNKKDDRP